MTKTLAYLGIPHMGGTFTVFLTLRRALEPRGFDVRWVGVGRQSWEAASQSAFDEFSSMGEVVGREATTHHAQLIALKEHLETGRYSTVLVNAACGLVETNIARYLNPSLHRVQIVHNITPGTYEYARIIEPWTHGTICVSPRASKDLVAGFGFPREKVFTVPSAVDMSTLLPALETARSAIEGINAQSVFRILFLGRIENASKGVFLLPKIAGELSDLPFRLTIVGDGPDLPALKGKLSRFDNKIKFVGRVAYADVTRFFASHDAFLFPSYYEGMPMSLLEAMACGCVPVASRIRWVTETMIDDGVNGFLFPIGDVEGAARALRSLWENAALREAFACRAQKKVHETFSMNRMAEGYVEALCKTHILKSTLKAGIDPAMWDFPERLSSRMRQRLPNGLKVALRKYREVLRAAAPEPAWIAQRSK